MDLAWHGGEAPGGEVQGSGLRGWVGGDAAQAPQHRGPQKLRR